jgi:signal transduction histidine kinase
MPTKPEIILAQTLKKLAEGEIDPDLVEKIEKMLQHLTEPTGIGSPDKKIQTHSGDLSKDNGGRVLIGIIAELTRQNSDYRDQLQDVKDSYEDVVGLITHEFKNILTSVHGYNMIIERQFMNQDNPALLENLQSSDRLTRQLFNMADSLLKMSLGEKGLLKPEYKLIHFIEDILTPIQSDLALEQKERKMKIAVKKPPDDPIIEGDDGLLDIVMRNLLINALKYGREGTEIEITVTRKNKDLNVIVKNECISLPKNFCSRIFEKFETKKIGSVKGGSGIGLYNVKKIIELHRGEVSCRVDKKKWVVFEILLPQTIF